MAHPYAHKGKAHPHSTERVSKMYGKFARGGKVKHGGKGHHTKINIVVAPKAGGDAPPPPMPPMGGPPPGGPPPGAGAAPPPMMPPKGPMMPPPGGAPGGAGLPGIGMKPGGMKRGGGVPGGLASPENLKGWADYASKNTRYERGGKVPMDAGAITGQGRKDKIKAYGKRARGN